MEEKGIVDVGHQVRKLYIHPEGCWQFGLRNNRRKRSLGSKKFKRLLNKLNMQQEGVKSINSLASDSC